jgi:hypothetical protein
MKIQTRQTVGMMLLMGLLGLAGADVAYGACDQAMLQRLLDQGFSRDEILRLCGPAGEPQLPATPPAGTPGTPPGVTPPPPPPEDTRNPAVLVGTWEGFAGPTTVRMILAADGSYQFHYTMHTGAHGVQVGKWFVEGTMFWMVPTPGTPEQHPYVLDETKTRLDISGVGGTMRLKRS